jgi:hypothetical protein
MKTKTEEICGSFVVVNEKRELQKVVVIQDVLSHYPKEHRCSKTFRLESINGMAVYRTDDPDIFKLIDGTLLKKRIR